MKKSNLFIGIVASAIVIFSAFFAINAQNNNKKEADIPRLVSTNIQSEDGLSFVSSDSPGFDTIKELAAESNLVVRGEVIKKSSNTRNLARNPLNPKEEAKGRKTISQEYEFMVTKCLKGNSDKIISIIYPDYTVTEKLGKVSKGKEPLVEGKEYVLFLLKDTEDGTYYGAAEPWQFMINSDSSKTLNVNSASEDSKKTKIEIKTKAEGVKLKDLKEGTLEELEQLVK